MPTDREKWLIGALDVNNGTDFDMESFVFTPAQKKTQLVSSGDSDGEALARESHYTSAYAEMEIRVAHQVDTAAAIAKLGELTDAVQGCEREEGGRACPWTPNDTETTYTAYAISGDITELPIAVAGDEAGWFMECPKVKVKLTLRPFLELPERVVLEPVESAAAPLQELFVGDIEGDVPALGRLIVTDEAGEDRRFAQYGRDVVFDEEPPGCLITAADLVTEGFSGAAKTRIGAYGSEKVKRATAVSSATTICGTGRIEHVGSFGVYLRGYAGSEDARFRISYRNGDGPLIPLKWQTPPVVGDFSDLYMGEVSLDQVELGEQTSEIRVEHESRGASHENDVNYLQLLPTMRGSCSARGRANNTPTKLLALDEFLQSEGALAGKALQIGGEWSGAGDADDFTVIAAEDVARRTAVSDANLNAGRYAIAGSGEYESVQISAPVSWSATSTAGMRFGVFARYGSTENWLMAVVTRILGITQLEMLKCVAGSVTSLGVDGVSPSSSGSNVRVSLRVDTVGAWVAEVAGSPWSNPTLTGQDAALAVGGSLEKGKVGVYDAWISGSANTRKYDTFEVLGADPPAVVCYADKQIEFNHRGVERVDEAGEHWGQPDFPRGSRFHLQPAGDDGAINRVVVRMRRNDVAVEPDSHVEDKHSVEVRVVERYLLPR